MGNTHEEGPVIKRHQTAQGTTMDRTGNKPRASHDEGNKESNKESPERQSLWPGSSLQRTPQSSFTTTTRRMDKPDKRMPEEG